MSLQRELQTYAEVKNQLLSEHEGKYVLIKLEQVIGVYPTYDEALTEGYKRCGNEEFLVQEISEIERINYFTRAVEIPS